MKDGIHSEGDICMQSMNELAVSMEMHMQNMKDSLQ